MDIPTLTSSEIPFRHGFFGRRGGVSEGIYSSLNCGPGSGDDRVKVLENRTRVAAHFGVLPEHILTLYQVHSPIVVPVSGPWEGAPPEADALVTATPGLLISILTADCGPVLLADPQARVIGAAHAGWKGAFGGVLDATVAEMERLGAKRERIRAALGPCIGLDSYEVGEEFVDRFLEQGPENSRFFNGNHFNLKAYIESRLLDAGIPSVDILPPDTCAEETDYFSYRRATLRKEGGYGRQISSIMID